MRIITCLLAIHLSAGSALAQSPPTWKGAVHKRGTSPETWVLVSGLLGGRAGFRALEDTLHRAGFRVVTIDPYRLSIDSADVTFEALARRVDAVLGALDVRHARVVGHSNGAGVALRLAAFAPDRVDALYLLDAGEWFDDLAQRAYIDPLLRDIGRVVSMAIRLGDSTEPDSLSVIVARVPAPVTVILGDVPHPSEPGTAELDALRPIGARLTVIRVSGVGHFPHEEALAVVAGYLLRKRDSVVLAGIRK